MRAIACRSVALASFFLSTGAAHAGSWCAHYVLHTNCGFYSFAQCAATLSGNAGFCSRNQLEDPGWTGGESRRRSRRD